MLVAFFSVSFPGDDLIYHKQSLFKRKKKFTTHFWITDSAMLQTTTKPKTEQQKNKT